MTLDEQLEMATNATPVQPTQPAADAAQPVTIPVTQQPAQQPVQQQVQPAQQPVQQQVQPAQQPVQQQVQQTAQPTMDLNKAQEEAETQYAVGTLELGQKISTRAIDKLLLKPNEKVRVTVVGAPFFAPIHKVPDLNNSKIVCWSDNEKGYRGQCCRELDPPKPHYIIPVLVYSTMPGDPRKALPEGKSELKLVDLWDATSWDGFCEELINVGGFDALPTVDFVVTAGEYNNMTFKIQPAEMCFRPQYQEVVNNAISAWNSIGIEGALPTLGRLLNDEKYLKLTQRVTPPAMQEYQMSDI